MSKVQSITFRMRKAFFLFEILVSVLLYSIFMSSLYLPINVLKNGLQALQYEKQRENASNLARKQLLEDTLLMGLQETIEKNVHRIPLRGKGSVQEKKVQGDVWRLWTYEYTLGKEKEKLRFVFRKKKLPSP